MKIGFGPERLDLDDRLKRLDRECVPAAVRGNCNTTPIRVMVSAVRSHLTDERKTVTVEGRYQLPGLEGTKFTVINRHLNMFSNS